jgi:hypothetical protein
MPIQYDRIPNPYLVVYTRKRNTSCEMNKLSLKIVRDFEDFLSGNLEEGNRNSSKLVFFSPLFEDALQRTVTLPTKSALCI